MTPSADPFSPADTLFMRRALRLATLGRHASPNPMVGCVLVDSHGQKVGEGFHPQAGKPHAEVYALREADGLARGGTAYVTLEPCSHFGRTPPCAHALVEAGVRRVVVAMLDADTRVNGQGVEILRRAGVDVRVGLLAERAARLNAAYIKHRRFGVPYGIVKTATTLDGKIATVTGDSRWITSKTSRRWVHRQLRDRVDVIMAGVGTVIADNPSLTTRLDHRLARNPIRLIVDSHLRTPLDSRVVRQAEDDGRTWIAHLGTAGDEHQSNYEARSVKLIPCPPDSAGRVDLKALMKVLGTRGDVTSVLLEGGGAMIASALSSGIIDRYIAALAPKLVGGVSAPGPVGGTGLVTEMGMAVSLAGWSFRRSGADLVIDGLLAV